MVASLVLTLGSVCWRQRLEKAGSSPQQLEAIRQHQRELYQQMRRTKDDTLYSQEVAAKGAEDGPIDAQHAAAQAFRQK